MKPCAFFFFSFQVTTAKKVVEDLDISWATRDEEVEELATRSCHLAIKNVCPVSSWRQYKMLISDPAGLCVLEHFRNSP